MVRGDKMEEMKNIFFGMIAGGLVIFMCIVVITVIIQTWRGER